MKWKALLFSSLIYFLFSTSDLHADAMRKMYLPVDFTWTYGFNWLSPDYPPDSYDCSGGRVYHPGVDINKACKGRGDCELKEWLPIYAIADGEIVFADHSEWASAIIKHSFNDEKTYYSVYGHSRLNPRTAKESSTNKADTSFNEIKVGDKVIAGQQIGYLWDKNTGGAHLHYEVRKSNHPDPEGLGFCSILGGTSRNKVKDWYVHPVDFVKSEGYIDGHCADITGVDSSSSTKFCDSSNSCKAVICWFDSDDEEDESLCKDGVAHKVYRKYNNKLVLSDSKLGNFETKYYCWQAEDSVDIIDFLSVKSFIPDGGDSGGGNGNIPNPPNPHAGYVHDIGIHKVYVSPKKRKGYKSQITVTLEQLSQMSLNFRAKLKRKGVWEDVCVDFYLSDDDNYDSDDQHLGEKCKDLTKKKYRNKKKKSVYLRKVDMSKYITKSGDFYVFIKVYNDRDERINKSSEGDDDERALITVIGDPNDPIYQPNIPTVINLDGSSPVYKYWNSEYSNVQYTLEELSSDIAWNAFATQEIDTQPVYELWSGIHFFLTISRSEFDSILSNLGWEYRGIAFYAYDQPYAGTYPVYRVRRVDNGVHEWVADENKMHELVDSGFYTLDGPAWHVPILP